MTRPTDDPLDYNARTMDQEIFPNPVERHDLPSRRRRWPRVLAAVVLLMVLGIVFLPQILASRIGRRFVVDRIARKTNSTVTLEVIRTSWFGGTTIKQLWLRDPVGRRIGFQNLTCKATLLDLLRGKWKLGDASVDGLYFDYVIDDGRGADSFDRMAGIDGSPGEVGDGPAAPKALWPISGKVQVNSGTICLWRGTVQPKLHEVAWEAAYLTQIKGTFDIPRGLDQPGSYAFEAQSYEDGQESGTIRTSGTMDLGEGGRLDPQQMALDVTLSGENVRIAPLLATLIRGATPRDVRQGVGDVLNTVELSAKASSGKVRFDKFEAYGPVARVSGKPTFDLTRTPSCLSLASPTVISAGISRPAAAYWLVYLNPLFREAVGGEGHLDLTIDQLVLPLSLRHMKMLAGRGSISARAVVLARLDEMAHNEALPRNMASQVALLTGDNDATVTLEAQGKFTFADGVATIPPMTTKVSRVTMTLEGTSDLETGELRMKATFVPGPALLKSVPALGEAQFTAPVTGTVRQPQIKLTEVRGNLAEIAMKQLREQVQAQIAKMKSKESQRMMERSQDMVRQFLEPLKGPATAPATQP